MAEEVYPLYPDTLPMPDTGSYTGTVDQGLVRTSAPAAAPNQEVLFNSPRHDIALTFSMTNETFENNWLPWVLEFGFSWFEMPIVSGFEPVTITSIHRVRMTTDVARVKRGHNWLSATVGVEIVPGDPNDPLALGARQYDFIVAGSPASPSADTIVAGDPITALANPFISAEIYYYTVT